MYHKYINSFNIKFQLLENPKLPQKSCKMCIKEMEKFTKLKTSIQTTQNQLLDQLKNEIKKEVCDEIKIKLEPEECLVETDSSVAHDYDQNYSNCPTVKDCFYDENLLEDENNIKASTSKSEEINLPIRHRTLGKDDKFLCDFCGFKTLSKMKLYLHVVCNCKFHSTLFVRRLSAS